MMDTPRPEPPLRNLEPAPFAQEHVRRRNADILQLDFHMAVRRIIIPEDGQVAQDVYARRVELHQDH